MTVRMSLKWNRSLLTQAQVLIQSKKLKEVLKAPGFSHRIADKATIMGEVRQSKTSWKEQKIWVNMVCKKMQIKG